MSIKNKLFIPNIYYDLSSLTTIFVRNKIRLELNSKIWNHNSGILENFLINIKTILELEIK